MLYLSLLFRRALTRQIPSFFRSLEELIERLAKVKYKGLEADFELDKLRNLAVEAASELTEEVVLHIETAPEKNHDKPADD